MQRNVGREVAMKYCPECLQEYEDGAKVCADCQKVTLVGAEELAKRPGFRRVREDEDTTSFVRVATAEDPFEADAFTAAVSEAGIPVLTEVRHASAVGMITSGIARPWWDILVPEDKRDQARAVVEQRRNELLEAQPEAEQAAEDEERESEDGVR